MKAIESLKEHKVGIRCSSDCPSDLVDLGGLIRESLGSTTIIS